MGLPTGTKGDILASLKDFIDKNRNRETFSTMLEQFRVEKEMTTSQLYNGAWVQKQLYSKIIGNRDYHPKKSTVIAFGLSLRLDKDSMDKLLETAGYRFSNSCIADLVILFCIENNLFNLHDVNDLLDSFNQKIF